MLSAEKHVDLTVVIVSWNVRDLLRRCLRSISDRGGSEPGGVPIPPPQIEVIVVDNASSDGSAEMVRAEFPQVRLIANDENRGFTAANNQGLAAGQGRYLMLLNPDTELVGDALATMAGYLDGHPRVGVAGTAAPLRRWPAAIVAPALSDAGHGPVREHRRREWWPNNPFARRYRMADTPDDAIQPVDWLVGACLLVRREAYQQVGGLDEGFFMYSEELDWCRRIKSAGWEIVYLPTATVVHHEGKSSEQVVAARHIYFQSSKVRYFRKHHGAVQAELLRWFLLCTYVYQWTREGLKWLIGRKRPMRAERMKAYRQVLRSGLRPP